MKKTPVFMGKVGIALIYACEDCGFLFYRAGEIEDCPSCEKNRLRLATKEEIKQLQSFLTQAEAKLRVKAEKAT